MVDYYLSSTDIAECISNLIARNKLWAGKSVKVYFIVNSNAGCFHNRKVSKHYYKLFTEMNNSTLETRPCTLSVNYEIFHTEYQGHATEITKEVFYKIYDTYDNSFQHIVVTAGGDGTSLEVQTALYNVRLENEEEKNNVLKEITVLRLPLGTGNDGTDCTFIGDTFDFLKSSIIQSNAKVLVAYTDQDPSIDKIKNANKLVSKYCDLNSKSPWFSFNIASIGIDSFICFVTNLVKSKFPGNLYHLVIPICGLFYDAIFKTGQTKIDIYNNVDDETPSDSFSGEIFLTAMGTSGNRTYGGGHKVLPNFNNICIASKIPLWRVIRDNPKFANGTHVGTDIGRMYSADKIKVYNDQPLMLQCDGECYLLCKEHFPLTLEKRNAGFNILRKTM